LSVYSAGTVQISGGGIVNANLGTPTSTQFYGTAATTGQTWSIKGNGGLSAVVYAPNADVTINGNGAVYGAVVGNSVTMTGGGNFHYDLSLANMNGNPLFQPSKWVELVSAADRATYATQLP
jgi:GH43 family beta-xylosidase